MMFKALLFQEGGCNIGCEMIDLNADSLKEANKELAEMINSEYSEGSESELASVTLYETCDSWHLDIDDIYEIARKEKQQKEKEKADKERELYEQLKKKYEK